MHERAVARPEMTQPDHQERSPAEIVLPHTRLQAPRVPTGLVSRSRLLETIDAGTELPVTLVTGLPGAGKSTLIAEWAQRTADRMAWVTCDRADRDPAVLWTAVTAALAVWNRQARGDQAASVTHDRAPDAATVINQIENADQPSTIVIDDAHVPGAALAVLEPLIDWMPAHGRLIVISRRRPALPLSELQVRGRLLEIRDTDLRLTPTETAQMLEALDIDEHPRTIDEIHRQSEGWLASIMLTAQALKAARRDGTSTDAIIGSVHPALTAMLRDGLLASSGSQLRDFLLDVCILDELTPESCAALVGPERAATALRELDHVGLPVERVAATEGFRLHRQFRTVLHEAAVIQDQDRLVRQHAAAAAGFEAIGDLPRAIQHYTRAGEHEAAVSLVGASVLRGNYADVVAAIAAWLQEADLDLVRSDPTGQSQVLAAAGSILEGSLTTARRWLRRIGALPQPLDDRVRGQAAICWSGLCLVEGDLAPVEQHFQTAEQLRDDWPLVWDVLHFLVAARARLWSGQIEAATVALAAVDRDPRLDQLSEAAVLAVRAELAAVTGDTIEAVDSADEAVATIGELDRAAYPAMQDAYRARGLARYEQALLDAAEADLTQAFKAAEATRPAMATVALTGLAQVFAARGQMSEALDTLVEARSLVPASSPLHDAITTIEARLDLAIGDIDRARHLTQSVRTTGMRQLLEVRLATADGDADAAASELAKLPTPPPTPRAHLDHALLRARIEHLRGHREAARAALHDALVVAEPRGLVRPFFEDGADLWPLLVVELGRRPRSSFAAAMKREIDRLSKLTARAVLPAHDAVTRLTTLTRREHEILRLLASDQTVRQLANELHISMNTLRTHIKSIYRKLDVATRADAVRSLL